MGLFARSGLRRFSRSSRRRASRRSRKKGTAVVEFAVVAPLLFLLIFGIIEFGRMVMVQQLVTNASREGARRAVLESTTISEIEQVVRDHLADSSITGETITVSPAQLNTVGFGDPVTVSVSVPFGQVSWLPGSWFLDSMSVSADSTMLGERPE